MFTAHQISKSYDNNQILHKASFSINQGERVGLIGPNGCGKTTLLRILSGEEKPDSGSFSKIPSDLKIGYLPQAFTPPPGITVEQLIFQTTDDAEILEQELALVASRLAENPNHVDTLNTYDELLNRFQQPSLVGQLSSILSSLELDRLPEDQLVSTLSGGQKTRFSLALVLLSNPQILLLDEPTNHLDIVMLEWLETWLNDFQGTALIVTHDRTFLDITVSRILELNPSSHAIRSFDGSYSEYIETVTREHDKQMSEYHDQVNEIRRMKQDIHRTRAQAERTEREASSIRIGGERMKIKGYKDYQQSIAKKVARKAKSREKKLDRYQSSTDRVEKPKAGWQINLKFNNTHRLGKDVCILENLKIGFPGYDPLLQDINLAVQANQRIAFTGPNGSGKTTLLRSIRGLLEPIDGRVRLGASVKLGYMSQEQESLDPNLTAVEYIQTESSMNSTEIRNFLHHFLFRGDGPLQPISTLSFGERSRLLLAGLIVQECNFLILDEPINHLDIPSRENFENALTNFEGTILAVVHDRYFIQRFASDLWTIKNKGIQTKILTS